MSAKLDYNLSAVLYQCNDLRLEKRDIPTPKDNEVLLRVANVGICGTDIHLYLYGKVGDFILERPTILGHESSGIVENCGLEVEHLKKGDKVAIEPVMTCRICEYCKFGRYNLCSKFKARGIPPTNGSASKYICHPAHLCFKLPDNVSLEEGAMMEPLSVVVHGCNRAEMKIGQKVLVCGAGTIGLLAMMTAKAFGASVVCITDLQEHKLNLAKELGADIVKNIKDTNTEQLSKEIINEMNGNPDVTIECSGAESAVHLGVITTKRGGNVMLIGLGVEFSITIPIPIAISREIDLKGVISYANCFPTSISLVESGKVNVKPLVTHRYKLEEFNQAIRTVMEGKDVIKALISC